MSSEWELSELGKEATNASRPFSFKNHPEVVFVNTGDVLNGRFLHSNVSIGKGLPGQAKKALKLHDILLTEIRPGNGRFAYVDFDASRYVVSTKFMVIESLGRVLPRFLYHVITNQAALDEFQRIAESRSGTFPQITFDSIDHYPIPVPPVSEQLKLVEFWDALDDRITLLRETNATLEAIAQALFKSWFVDFDPVRAKAEGRARQDGERSGQPRMPQASDLPRPGAEAGAEAQGQPEAMDANTAALFPDSFEESELGLVPKGWEVLPLRQLCAFQKGCSYKGDGLADGEGAYMFNLGCFNEPRVYAFQKVKRYVGDYKPKHQVYPGDLIIANTDMTQQRDILGRPLLVPSGMEPGFISHHVFKVEVGGEFGNQIKNFLFFSFQQAVFRERAVGYATGTTVLALPRDALEEHCVVLPSQPLLMAFSDVVSPLLAAIHENEERATLLTQLRDTLLPRLISGQLRLPEAQEQLEEALL